MALTKVSRDLLATGIDDNSTSTAITIDSGQRVGLGTTSPTATFRASIKGDYSSVIGGIEFDSGGGDKFTIGHASATSPSGTLNVVGAGNMIFKTNNSEVGRFDVSGNLGLGTSSPSSYFSGATDLVISGSGESGLTVASGTSGAGRIHFADGTSGDARYRGYIVYSHASDSMQVATAGSERLRVESGNLLVGKTGNNNTTAGHRFTASGFAAHVIANDYPLLLNRLSSEGTLLTFRKDSSTVGRIGTRYSTTYISGDNSGILFNSNGTIPTNTSGVATDTAYDLGQTTARWKDLHLSTDAHIGNQILGGFGAQTTSGTTDWNHSTNARSGMGKTLLLGTHTNGPGASGYFHPVSFEYNTKNGTGNMTQLAIGYTNNRIFLRYRYSNSWSSWVEL